MLVINERIEIPLSELQVTHSRSGGPGGQNVNKLNTKVTMRWSVAHSPSLPDPVRRRFLSQNEHRLTKQGELIVTSQRYREQAKNLEDCYAKVKTLVLQAALPPKPRKATRPPRAARERRLHDKRVVAAKKKLRSSPAANE